jgi:CBS domain containing-hemolysin-like protein
MNTDYLLIFLSLFFSAFFSGMEVAYLASNRLKIEVQKSQGTLKSKIISLFYKKESTMIAMLLLGNNISLVIYGISAAQILNPYLISMGLTSEGAVLVIQTVVSTLLVLITAEFLPKAIVQINPNKFLNIGLSPMFICYILLFIPTQIILFISWLVLRIFGAKNENSDKVFSKVDLEHYVDDLNSRINSKEQLSNEMNILSNALDFTNVRASDCMIPRTEIIAVDFETDIDELNKLFVEKGLSKIMIFRDSIDNIIGYVHSYELFKNPKKISEVIKPISFIPFVMSGKELLEKFTKEGGHVAVVTDEYGGTAGIVTLEDVIEEIFGEIEDEHDKDNLLEEQISDTEFLFSARMDIDYLNEKYHLKFEESDEYDTLGGLIIHHLESIPENGKVCEISNYILTIEEVSDRRIIKVRINSES